jgi:hypothetical protein
MSAGLFGRGVRNRQGCDELLVGLVEATRFDLADALKTKSTTGAFITPSRNGAGLDARPVTAQLAFRLWRAYVIDAVVTERREQVALMFNRGDRQIAKIAQFVDAIGVNRVLEINDRHFRPREAITEHITERV